MINKDTFITGNVDETHKTHRKAAMSAILGDLLFIALPLVVISIVDVSVGRSLFAIIESPELSFGSAVLFGKPSLKLFQVLHIQSPLERNNLSFSSR